MILSRELGKRIWGGSTSIENGGGGVSSDYIAGLLAGYATESWVDEHYISIDFFSRLFQAHGTENGSEIDVMPNDMDTTITSVESMFGFWTNLYISALGSNGAAPAGISLGMLTDVTISGTPSAGQVLTFDAVTQKWVNGNATGASSLATLTDVTLTSLQTNQILVYNATAQKWVNSSVKTINGNSIFGTGDIPASGGGGGNYLPLAGGTMSGAIQSPLNGYVFYFGSGNRYVIGSNGTLDFYFADLVGSGNFAIYTGGSYPLFINGSTKKVGINTQSPISPLHVIGDIYSTGSIYSRMNGYSYYFGQNLNYVIGSNTTSNFYFADLNGAADILFYTNSVYPLVIKGSNGYIGIGTEQPSQQLEVNGQILSKGLFGIEANTSYQSSYRWGIYQWNDHLSFNYRNTSDQYLGDSININLSNGYVGIKNDTPSYQLHVSGTIYATGAITALSDARKKDITGEVGVTVEQIAHAPAVQFLWKDKERRKDGQQVGTLAQYWQTVLPEVVSDKGGELSMQYGVAALVSAIVTARKVVDHERRITELEKENERLKEEISQLRLLN